MFNWLKQGRRRELLATPFPPAWQEILQRNVIHYAALTEAEQAKLRDDLRIFADEKSWEGCRGLTITDEMQVTIAAHACLLLLAMDHDYFAAVKSVLVYPSSFAIPLHEVLPTGEVVEGELPALGEASYTGAVVLAWDDVLAGGRDEDDGRNTVYHEFAHQLDFLDGACNGTPRLEDTGLLRRWRQVMTTEYERLCRAIERGRWTLLEEDAALNEGEFFAVATEYFLGRPVELAEQHPQLYDLLRTYYRQDPARRSGHRWPHT
jgi:Mlc titration factor MtfA (ptsG expression regulator)